LDCTIGNTVGWFGLYSTPSTELGNPIEIPGYPVDKSPADTMWTESGTVASEAPFPRLFYAISTGIGQSGGPIHETDNLGGNCTTFCVIGIHANGTGGPDWPGLNEGTRITSDDINNLVSWEA
jgi:glutamyl endopeptidase